MTPEGSDPGLEALLTLLKEDRGFDFTGYKRASLTRRVRKRMAQAGVEDFDAYRELLDERPDEVNELFNTILINVTGFRRDAEAWDHLEHSVIPRMLREKDPQDPVRIWSAGCASGEEAYSLAVLLCDAMGDAEFRARVKIYGSDIDEDAIRQARMARYPPNALQEGFTDEQVQRYFIAHQADRSFRKDLRRAVIFGRHDLVRDPPISRIDLLVCRNTLMYLNADVQRQVLDSFHFALNDGGFLFLGKSEALVTRTDLFGVDDMGHHVFVKEAPRSGRIPMPTRPPPDRRAPDPVDPDGSLLAAAFEAAPLAQVLVDPDGRLVRANRRARTLFGLSQGQMGRPLKDLELSYRPVELRSLIEQVVTEHRQIIIDDVDWKGPDGVSDVYETRLQAVGPDLTRPGVAITFTETGQYQLLRAELDRSQRELSAAYEELQSTVEELETTNEELQSTNEELETTNEELHSSNEELETMNEELQSSNEELEAINVELRRSSGQLDRSNAYLGSILGSLGAAVIVLDDAFDVQIWNHEAEELWGLRSDEVTGKAFLDLDIGFPVDVIGPALAEVRAGGRSDGDEGAMDVDAINRRGRTVALRVAVTPLALDGQGDGAIIRMEVAPRPAAGEDQEAER